MIYAIDPHKVISLVHEAFQRAKDMPNGPDRELLWATANSAMAVAMAHMEDPSTEVDKKQHDIVQRLKDHMDEEEG